MELIFKNKELNKSFETEGYVIVDLPNPESILKTFHSIQEKLKEQNFDLSGFQNSNSNVSFHSTFLDKNKKYKRVVKNELSSIFHDFNDNYLCSHKIIQLNIFNKIPNSGFVSPHQNLTTVDEDLFTSLSIWVPLQDTNEKNGGLFFLPKSRKKFEKYRNPYIYWPPLKVSDKIEDYNMIPLNLSFGQALIFDDSVVHASPDNITDKSRLAFHCIAIPTNSQPIYPKLNDGYIDLVVVDDEFWFNYTPGEPEPENPVHKRIKYSERKYSKIDLI